MMQSFTDIPHISKGKNEHVKRKQKLKERPRKKAPQAKNDSKKLIIGAVIALCVVSAIVVVVVTGGDDTVTSEEVQTQFTGRIQLVELDEEFVEWTPEMSDLTSEKAKELIEKITPKIKSAYKKEGFQVSNIIVDTLTADPPKTVARNEPTQSIGRAQLSTETEVKKYANVQTINIGYKTEGIAKNNAVMVASVKPGRWPVVKKGLESRLAAEGIHGRLSSANVVPDFLSSVSEVISQDPVNVVLPLSDEPQMEECDCDAVYTVDVICNCASSCSDNAGLILGGRENYFSAHTKLCVSAYYADLIKGSGGEFEVLSQGKFDKLEKGPEKRGLVPHGINWRLSVILLKSSGTAVKPTLPTDPATTTTSKPAQFKEDGLFLINLQYNRLNDEEIVYSIELQDIESRESTALKNKMEPVFIAAPEKSGFSDVTVKFIHFDQAHGNNGVIVSARYYSSNSYAAQIAVDLEKKSPRRVNKLIESGFPPNDHFELIGFRYSQKFIEEMKKVI